MNATGRLALAALAALGVSALAQGAVNVQCIGLESGGWGGPLGWQYAYEVTVLATPGNIGMDVFQVGTCDMVWANYSRVMITDGAGNPIPGWVPVYPGGQQNPSDIELHWQDKTPHGIVSQGPQGQCLGYVRWAALAGTPAIPVGTSVFCGFDNPNESHDVGWTARQPGLVSPDENWAMPVGTDAGPVHGPLPEPTALALLALGACLPLWRKRRQPGLAPIRPRQP